ncbi:exodeoxyribonuclease V subunit gamma [Aeromicrobium chenweiae]|uniref:RecBCD enzyme subunit RecC n=1 Tax=Aeromicrobium chenweiae TaxID=2079793 RepID=A0A2S0WMV1_9ACTN|nr:exodeoxyribonuclease V subunit gamma [Aeromicrobium chenweiae]AWB92679.1 exodeoxyribonuclease V subunit gamma [Aeromicrobium chenweiae]TGN33669.1 exodeoxyribonuclease V subunit gamma [Aeromicrobium chenweiae]
MTFHVHRAERLDTLVGGLAELLAEPLPDPFAEEIVVVPARGVERWLAQQLGHRLGVSTGRQDGVCAGIRFASPHSLVAELLGIVDEDPWDPDRLVWPLLDIIDASMGEPWCRALSRHLGHEHTGVERELRQNRRYGVARRLAGLFASYAVQRPELITAWNEGRDDDGAGTPLEPDVRWQAELWRRLTATIDAPTPDVRLAETVEGLVERPETYDLPSRVSLLGHTRLSAGEVRLLDALAQHRDVHLWLPHPSPALWDSLTDSAGAARRSDDPAPTDAPNPLLISLGRDVREVQRTLQGLDGVQHEHLPATRALPQTLLGWLQDDIVHDRSGGAERVLTDADRSVQIHACHGKARQIDVLREVLVGLLEDDPTLEPRDILVMCPDIDTYAPLISAAFGLAGVVEGGHPAHELRVRLADRGTADVNPLAGVARSVLDLATKGRITATEVLDFVAMAPVRHRFALSDDDLERVTRWVERSGVRWAFDGAHRASFGLEDLKANTWQFGLDRVLLGGAVAEHRGRWIDTVLPLDDVSSGDLDLAGRFAELMHRLRTTVDRMMTEQSLPVWVQTLTEGVTSLASTSMRDSWQLSQLERELARIAESGTDSTTPLRLAEVSDMLAGRLGSRPTRSSFRTGTLTVCTMVPMRSVPHRVVCMIGLDDGEFPRVGAVHGDDVLARDPMTGERDVRTEDRQLLLDAVMAATETLVITYTGADERTGQPRPPAVPLGELVDQLDRTADQEDVRERVVVHHPLQPFDRRNVLPDALVPGRPFSFDPAALAGARATVVARPDAPAPFLPGRLDPPPNDDVSLRDLADFLAHPVKAFLRQRLDVGVLSEIDPVADEVPIELDALQKWSVGDRVLRDALSGADPNEARQAEYRRGIIPPGQIGRQLLDEVVGAVTPLVQRTTELRSGAARSVDIDVLLDDGRRVVGSVTDVHGDHVVAVTYSSLAAKHRVASWLNLLALASSEPDVPWVAHAIGRYRKMGRHAEIGPINELARQHLADLVALRDLGLCEPLPLPLKTSLAYAEQRKHFTHSDALEAARKEWDERSFGNNQTIPGDSNDAHHGVVWGLGAPLETLLDADDASATFAVLAQRLWDPMLQFERVDVL